MITLSVVLTFVGFWICYLTSRRTPVNRPNVFEVWVMAYPKKGRMTGIAGLIAGLAFSMNAFGVGSGIFAFLILLTVVSSLTIILAPLGFINGRNVGATVIISIVLELTV